MKKNSIIADQDKTPEKINKMRKIAFLTIFILAISQTKGSKTKVKVYYKNLERVDNTGCSNKNFIHQIGRYLFSAKKDTKSAIYNITDVHCYQAQDLCLVSGNRIIELYQLNKDNSLTRINTYYQRKIRRMLISLMRVRAIQKTNYFLASGKVREGVMRWRIDHQKHLSKLLLNNIPKYLATSNLHAMKDTKFGAITFRTWKQLVVFDYIQMEEVYRWTGHFGLIAYLSRNPSKSRLALGEENRIKVLSYSSGIIFRQIPTDYYINAMVAIPDSEIVILGNINFVRVYDTSIISYTPEDSYVYSYNMKKSIYGVCFNELSKQIFINGQGFALGLIISDPLDEQCHPACDGCTIAFSSYACRSCKRSAVMKEGKCQFREKSAPSGGKVDYETANWSTESYSAYIPGLTWSMIVYIIVALFLVFMFLICTYFSYLHACHKSSSGGRRRRRLRYAGGGAGKEKGGVLGGAGVSGLPGGGGGEAGEPQLTTERAMLE